MLKAILRLLLTGLLTFIIMLIPTFFYVGWEDSRFNDYMQGEGKPVSLGSDYVYEPYEERISFSRYHHINIRHVKDFTYDARYILVEEAEDDGLRYHIIDKTSNKQFTYQHKQAFLEMCVRLNIHINLKGMKSSPCYIDKTYNLVTTTSDKELPDFIPIKYGEIFKVRPFAEL